VKVSRSTSCVILAGGKCRRLGQAKYFIKIGSVSIIERILAVVKEIFKEIIIVTNDKGLFPHYGEIKVVEDLEKDCGPLAGIFTGLSAIRNTQAFFVAGDMPFVNSKSIKELVNIAERQEYDCVIPRMDTGFEVLHAVYAKSLLPLIKEHLQQKRLAIHNLLCYCNCWYLDINEQSKVYFTNINTAEDLARIQD